ncbi:MAG: hypothetical protein IPN38_15485 [Flavobacteriales bacterium]|nr:hypothetical protein [Flavobacteriales bacterium]
MSKKTRTEQRAAEVQLFTQLVQVCMEHRAVWCTHALSNQAMAALFNSVELLAKVQHVVDPPPPTPAEHALDSAIYTLRKRIENTYRMLEHAQQHPADEGTVEQQPIRPLRRPSLTKTESELLAFATALCNALALGKGPSYAHHLAVLQSSIATCTKRLHLAERSRRMSNVYNTYPRQLNSCLRHLVERVDPVTIRFAEHTPFSTAYKAARKPLLKLEVGARKYVKSA